MTFSQVMLVALGAAIGANARYLVGLWATERFGSAFPYGTLIINVLGSFVIGVVLGLAATHPAINANWRLLLVTGLLGGFTTFSSFSYETWTLISAGNLSAALLYVGGSVALGLTATALGVAVARLI